MLLGIDVGNSQTSYGLFDGKKLLFHWRGETKHSRTPDELASFLLPLFVATSQEFRRVREIALCSVVPPLDSVFEEFADRYFDCKLHRIDRHAPLGIELRVRAPEEVGADRLVNAAYAATHLALPAIVVDLGTGTTFDVVDNRRGYLGGLIVPGIRTGLEALSARTAKLPRVDLKHVPKVIGSNTVECLQSGVVHGYASLVDGIVEKIEKELGAPCSLTLTGGLAEFLHPHLGRPAALLPDLTLVGIREIAERMP